MRLTEQDTGYVDEEVLPVAEAARQLRQRFPRAPQVSAGLVRLGLASGLLGVGFLLYAGLPDRRSAELRAQVHDSDRPPRFRLRRYARPGSTVDLAAAKLFDFHFYEKETLARPELSVGPFCVTRSNPTHQLTDPTQPNLLQVEKFGPNPTQPNTTNNGAYSLVVTYFIQRTYLVLLVNQAYFLVFFTVITHIKNSDIMSFKYKLFKEMFKMSSAAAQKASTKLP